MTNTRSEKRKANTGRHEAAARSAPIPTGSRLKRNSAPGPNTSKLAKRYRLSRDSIYRHVSAFNLRERRGRNLRAALERIIEQADAVKVNTGAVVQAIQAYAKINAAGQWVSM
jgi:hypothetical protein